MFLYCRVSKNNICTPKDAIEIKHFMNIAIALMVFSLLLPIALVYDSNSCHSYSFCLILLYCFLLKFCFFFVYCLFLKETGKSMIDELYHVPLKVRRSKKNSDI